MSLPAPVIESPRLRHIDVGACLSAFVLIGASQALHGPALSGISVRFDIDTVTAALIVGAHWSGALLSTSSVLFFILTGVVGIAFSAAFLWATEKVSDQVRGAPIVVVAALCGGISGPVSIGYLSRLTGDAALFALLACLGAIAFTFILFCEMSSKHWCRCSAGGQ